MKKLIVLMTLALFACGETQTHKPANNPAPSSQSTQQKDPYFGSDISAEKLGINFALPATTGKTIQLSDSAGKVTILVFGYAQCPDVCPTNLLTYADAIRSLGEKGKDIQLYFITVDPERDTLERMSEYVTIFHPKFIGLVADTQEKLEAVKKAWRIVSRKVPLQNGNYLVDHSAGTYLINKQGQTILYEPHGQNAKQLAQDLQTLLE